MVAGGPAGGQWMVLDLKIAPSGQTIVKPTALGPVANTDTKLLIYGLFQKGRVLAQDAVTETKTAPAASSRSTSFAKSERERVSRSTL